MKTPLLPDEALIKDGSANMQRGIEAVGGKLYLTNKRVVFESHSFNIQTGATVLWLPGLASTRACWTKFLNVIPLFPNSLAIVTKDGKEHRFVTFGRQAWIEAIQGQMDALGKQTDPAMK